MKRIEVVAAIFLEQGKVFAAQRANKGALALKWEFPGGKIEQGETKEAALKREIKEELSTHIDVGEFFMTVEHTYDTFHLTMHTYLCTVNNGNLTLNEHTDSQWVDVHTIDDLDWAAADIPIVEKLKRHLSTNETSAF